MRKDFEEIPVEELPCLYVEHTNGSELVITFLDNDDMERQCRDQRVYRDLRFYTDVDGFRIEVVLANTTHLIEFPLLEEEKDATTNQEITAD